MMRTITLFNAAVLITAPLCINAQTMTSADNPVVGDVVTMNRWSYMEPGDSGADQTWDFSAMGNTGSIIRNYVAPSSTIQWGSFTTATVATSNPSIPNAHVYYKNNSAGSYVLGSFDLNNGSLVVYQNSAQIMKYPCSFNTTWYDDFSSNFNSQGDAVVRTGSINGVANGYGTLVMPYGTITNVLRVRTDETILDEIAGSSTVDYYLRTYKYYKPGVHFPLVIIYDQTIISSESGPTYIKLIEWNANTTIGIQEAVENAIGIDLYPNPATANTRIVFSGTGVAMQLELVDATGRLFRSENVMNSAPGIQQHDLDVSGMPAGIYHLRITSEDGQQGVKRMVVQ